MDEITIRLLLLGDSTVGKSSLITRFADNRFEENMTSSIGINNKFKCIIINNQKIKLNIFDTSGQERYHSLAKSYLRRVDGIIFVFDLTNDNTFENIRSWLMESYEVTDNFHKILVGNKLDLEDIQVDTHRVEKLCEKYNMKYFKASAKNGTNIKELFFEITKLILDSKQKEEKEIENKISRKNTKIKLQKEKSKNSKERKCCK